MDEHQKRQIFEKARAVLARRDSDAYEHARWLETHRDRVTGLIDLMGEAEEIEPPPQQQRSSEALVYKTYETPPSPSEPAQDWSVLNAWLKKNVENALDNYSDGVLELFDELRNEVAELRNEVAELCGEVGDLRADLTITRTIVASRNVLPIDGNDGVVRKDAEAKSDVA